MKQSLFNEFLGIGKKEVAQWDGWWRKKESKKIRWSKPKS